MAKTLRFSLAVPVLLYVFFISCARGEFSDFEKTESGLMYKFYVKSADTVHPKYGEIVRLKVVKRMGDSILESTELINQDGMEQLLRKGAFQGAVEEGITMMALGDSATFLVSTDSVNKYYAVKDSTQTFKQGSYLAFDVKLMNIQTQEEARWEREQNRKIYVQERKEKESKELDRYIQDNHIDVKPTNGGLYFIEIEKGAGAFPREGDSVVMHYTGSFLNGTIFGSSLKSNEPLGFIVGDKGTHGVIDGWYEGIKMMRKGGRATWIIPSSLAFDSTGMFNRQLGKYTIPPYSALKFEIQLLDVKPGKINP